MSDTGPGKGTQALIPVPIRIDSPDKRKMTEHTSFKNGRNVLELLWPVVLSLAVGALSAFMQSESIRYLSLIHI